MIIETLVEQAYQEVMNQSLRPQDKAHVVAVCTSFLAAYCEQEPVAEFLRDIDSAHGSIRYLAHQGVPLTPGDKLYAAPVVPDGMVLVPRDALEALKYQRQCDEDGIEIAVSRQAVYELIAAGEKKS